MEKKFNVFQDSEAAIEGYASKTQPGAGIEHIFTQSDCCGAFKLVTRDNVETSEFLNENGVRVRKHYLKCQTHKTVSPIPEKTIQRHQAFFDSLSTLG